MPITLIVKRDNEKTSFNLDNITSAILKAMNSVNHGNSDDALRISNNVYESLNNRFDSIPNYIPNVEEVQDIVEQKLMQSEFLDVAKSYILYRNNQAEKRKRNVFF